MSLNASLSVPAPIAEPVTIDPAVLAAQRGDGAAFATLYDQYAARVFALCVGLTGDRASATELVQDVFVRVWENIGSFRGDCAFATWLHRVAVNRALESKRRDGRRTLRVAIAADLETGDGGSPLLTAVAPPSDTGLAMDIEAAVARLPDGARAVFVLHDIEGFQHAEIAEQLHIAVGTSKAHLFRARRLLREMLTS